MEEIMRLMAQVKLRGPASAEAIEQAERALGVSLPRDYAEFLRLHNGGEGPVGENWVILHPVDDLVEENELCAEIDHFEGWLLFGGTGGGEAFLFGSDGEVLVVPFIGDREDAIPQGRFAEFVRRLNADTIFERERG